MPVQIPENKPTEIPSEIPSAIPSEIPAAIPAEIPSAIPSVVPASPPAIPPLGEEMKEEKKAEDPLTSSTGLMDQEIPSIPAVDSIPMNSIIPMSGQEVRAVPNIIPEAPASAQPMMKETSLAWAVWPFTPSSGPAPVAKQPITGGKLIPYRVATKPGSAAARAYQARLAANAATATATADPFFSEEPAKPVARPGLHYRGGRTLREMAYVNLYLGGEEHWKQGDVLKIDDNIKAAMTDPGLNAPLKQYFDGKPVSTVPLASHPMIGEIPEKITREDLRQTLRGLHAQGYLDDFDLDVTVFNILCPRGVVLSDDIPDLDSTAGLAGYHGSIKADFDTVYYSVVVASEISPDGTENGIAVFPESWKNVVAMLYHQMQEVRTNPDSEDALRNPDDPTTTQRLGWTSDTGEEIGDLLLNHSENVNAIILEVPLSDGSGTVPVQRLYSNEEDAGN